MILIFVAFIVVALLLSVTNGCKSNYNWTEQTTVTETDGSQTSVEKKITEEGYHPSVQPFFGGSFGCTPYYPSPYRTRYFDGTGFYHYPQSYGAGYYSGGYAGQGLSPSWFIFGQ